MVGRGNIAFPLGCITAISETDPTPNTIGTADKNVCATTGGLDCDKWELLSGRSRSGGGLGRGGDRVEKRWSVPPRIELRQMRTT